MSTFTINGIREIEFILTKSSITKLKKDWKVSLKNSVDYPDVFNGKGIVLCAGGIKYFTCAWICIQQLRRLGCKLPIEVWYIGHELSAAVISELNKSNVISVNYYSFKKQLTHNLSLKAFAIIHSRFQEIIFIDSDNTCNADPEYLFYCKQYNETGAIFWPDYWETADSNPIWDVMGVEFRMMAEQESGQIVIDKKRSWKPLQLCMYLNEVNSVYYKLLLGDKDTFRFSWLALNAPFYFIETPPHNCGYFNAEGDFLGNTMIQFGPDENPMFFHRNLLKWDLTVDTERAWKMVKKFKKNATYKNYYIGYSFLNSHSFLDFRGDFEIYDFQKTFGKIEDDCIGELLDLRRQEFYKQFLFYSYIQKHRYTNVNM